MPHNGKNVYSKFGKHPKVTFFPPQPDKEALWERDYYTSRRRGKGRKFTPAMNYVARLLCIASTTGIWRQYLKPLPKPEPK